VGFDVVIGNPPYIPLESFSTNERKFFNDKYNQLERKYETSVSFVLEGLMILNQSGLLCYTAPVTWQTGAILIGYMMFKPKFDQDNPPQKQMRERKIRAELLNEFYTKYDKELGEIEPTAANYSKIDFALQGIRVAETAFQIIPLNSND
jgi:hypothetical protein